MGVASAKNSMENGYFNHGQMTNCLRNGEITHAEERIFFTPSFEIGRAYALQRKDIGILFECGIVGEILYSTSPLHEYFYTKDKMISTDIVQRIYLVGRVDGEKKILKELTEEELLKMGE